MKDSEQRSEWLRQINQYTAEEGQGGEQVDAILNAVSTLLSKADKARQANRPPRAARQGQPSRTGAVTPTRIELLNDVATEAEALRQKGVNPTAILDDLDPDETDILCLGSGICPRCDKADSLLMNRYAIWCSECRWATTNTDAREVLSDAWLFGISETADIGGRDTPTRP